MMKHVLCPQCEAHTILAAQKPFCRQCGWNLEAARLAIRSEVLGIWACITVVDLLALLFIISKGGDWAIVISAGFMTCIVLGYYFLSMLPAQKTLHAAEERFGSQNHEEARKKQTDAGLVQITRVPPDWIFRISKPRTVRVCWQKVADRVVNRTFASGAALLIFCVFFLATIRDDIQRASVAFLAIGLILLFFLGFRTRIGFKRYRLLQNGDVVVGRVLSQERAGEWKLSRKINYEFEDLMGRLASGTATDLTGTLYESMPVLVFYNSGDIEERAALCETFFGIVVENGNLILDS